MSWLCFELARPAPHPHPHPLPLPALFPAPPTGVQNIVFGQLGALALSMRELGLKAGEIERQIMDMSRGAQLTEEHELLLLRSIKQL